MEAGELDGKRRGILEREREREDVKAVVERIFRRIGKGLTQKKRLGVDG